MSLRRARRALTAVVLLALLPATVGQATVGQAQPDPRAAEIKKRLEYFGLKVVEVAFAPARGSAPAVWGAGTVAGYAQPSWDRVTDQAMTVWNVMFAVLKKEDPQTLFAANQDWKNFRLLVATRLSHITAFDAGVRTAQTDAERNKVFQTLYSTITFKVFNLQQQKLIDEKEFIKTYFVK